MCYFLNMFRNRKSWVSSERSASCGLLRAICRLSASASGSAIAFMYLIFILFLEWVGAMECGWVVDLPCDDDGDVGRSDKVY